MPNNLSYQITADDSQAVSASARVERSFDAIEQTGKRAFGSVKSTVDSMTAGVVASCRNLEAGFNAAGRAVGSFTVLVFRGVEAVLALAAAHAALTAGLAKYSATAVSAATNTDALVNTYRGARLVFSPTFFTGATLAAGFAAEELIKLTNNQARLIQQRASSAYNNDSSYASVERDQLINLVAGHSTSSGSQLYAASAATVGNYNLGFSLDTDRQKILQVNQDLESLSVAAGGVGRNFRAAVEQLKELLAVGTANSWDFVKRIADYVNLKQIVGGPSGSHFTLGGEVPDSEPTFLQMLNSAANAPSYGQAYQDTAPYLRSSLSNGLNALSSATQSSLLAGAQGSLGRYDVTPQGINAALGRARSLQTTLLDKVRSGKPLTIEELSTLQSAQSSIPGLFSQSQGFEINRFQFDEQRSSQNQLIDAGGIGSGPLGSAVSQYGRSSYDAAHRVAQDINGDPYLQQVSATYQTRLNLEQAFQARVHDYQVKSIAETQKADHEQYEQRLRYDETIFQRRLEFDRQTLLIGRTTTSLQSTGFEQAAGYTRTAALQGLEFPSVGGTRQELSDIAARRNIQQRYLDTTSGLKADTLNRQQGFDITDFDRTNLTGDQVQARIDEIQKKYSAEAANLSQQYNAETIQNAQEAAIKSSKVIQDSQKGDFDSIKGQVSGLLDVLTSKTKDLGAAVGQFFRDAALKPLKEIAATQLSKLIYGAFGGGSVQFAQSGGNGGIGGFRNLLGGAGLGAPSFSGAAAGGGTIESFVPTSVGSIGSFGASASPFEAVLAGGGPSSSDSNQYLNSPDEGTPAAQLVATGGFVDSQGLPFARTPYFSPIWGSAASTAGSGNRGGIFSQAGISKLLSNPKGLLSTVYNSGSISLGNGNATTAAGISQSLGGGVIGTLAGGAAGFISSPAGAALGGSLLLGGVTARNQGVGAAASTIGGGTLLGGNLGANGQLGNTTTGGIGGGLVVGAGAGLLANGLRRGGVGGIFEDTAGGAAIGFEYGGPIGAAVGAVAGAVAGLIRLRVKSRTQQVQDEVMKLYGLKLSLDYAAQIDQISQQTFGGSISAAIRSPQVQQMLSVYAQATGQKFLFSNQPRAAFLTESGGTLTQQATYVNGQAYNYAGGLPVYGGVNTSTLPQANLGLTTTTSPNGGRYTGTTPQSMSLQLDGPATTALLSGQIASSSQQVAQAYSTAQQNSFDRRSNAARILNPNLVTS